MTVTGAGRGGRNQEFALAVARTLATDAVGDRPVVAACAGTYGIDGHSPAAGAIVDAATVARATAAGLDIADVLARNDTYSVFERLGDAIVTGPTGTNVGDLQVALVG
jgi:glycerate-2-kinase